MTAESGDLSALLLDVFVLLKHAPRPAFPPRNPVLVMQGILLIYNEFLKLFNLCAECS